MLLRDALYYNRSILIDYHLKKDHDGAIFLLEKRMFPNLVLGDKLLISPQWDDRTIELVVTEGCYKEEPNENSPFDLTFDKEFAIENDLSYPGDYYWFIDKLVGILDPLLSIAS